MNTPNETPKKKKQKSPNDMSGPRTSPLIWLFLVSLIVSVFALYGPSGSQTTNLLNNMLHGSGSTGAVLDKGEIPLSQLLVDANKFGTGGVKMITVEGADSLKIEYNDGSIATSKKEPLSNLIEMGIDPAKVAVSITEEPYSFLKKLVSDFLPMVLIFFVLMFIMRKMMGAGGSIMGTKDFEKQNEERPNTKFSDVAGAEESKEELLEVVDFLKHGEKYRKMGAKIPRGVLLYGPPGTGKTLLAKAVAGEADVPFFAMAGSEFEEMFVGVGASRVRSLFDKAKKEAPSIIFIDEIDAVGRRRQGSSPTGGGSDQTLNQILVELDGFESNDDVIIIAATNRPEVLDPALLRPGRFDRRVSVDLPNIIEREAILKVHAKNKPLDAKVSLAKVAQATSGFSGADLSNILNEAAILATKRKHKTISQTLIDTAIEKVVIGLEKKTRKLSEQERKITAYHEAGHAITGHSQPLCEPVHKISIVSRGSALGVTWYRPQEEKHLVSTEQFQQELVSYLGGRAAEEVMFGSITTGASNDLERATHVARSMVMKYGMSSLWNISFGSPTDTTAWNRSCSEKTLQDIDAEVQKILATAYTRALEILTDKKDLLVCVGEQLLEKETLERDEFLVLLGEAPESTPATEEIQKTGEKPKEAEKIEPSSEPSSLV